MRIDEAEPRALAAQLPAEQEMDVERIAVALERGAVELRHAADLLAHQPRSVVERADARQAAAGLEVASQQLHHGLGER